MPAMLLFLIALTTCSALAQAQHRDAARTPDAAGAGAPANSASIADRLEVFEEVWKTIDEKYYSATFNGIDWKAMRERYRPLVEAAADDESYYALLDRMAGELRDSHTRVFSPRRRQASRKQQAVSIGLRISEVEGVPVVSHVTTGSEAWRRGVVPGMLVRAIGGLPLADALAAARHEVGVSSSERATRMRAYSRLVSGEPGTQLKLALTRADKTPFEVTLTRLVVKAEPQFTARLLPSGNAYLSFDQFTAPIVERLEAALQKFKAAPGLILDLRNNGGGDGEEGLRFAGYFFDREVFIARLQTRTGKPPIEGMPPELEAGRKGGRIYPNSVVILTNEGTASTSELITATMQEHGRARIIGAQTCGCVLGVVNLREIRGGGALSLSEFGFVTSRGRTLEGVGIIPDIAVAHTLSDVQSGRDAALEEAEKYLNSLRGRSAKRRNPAGRNGSRQMK